MRDVETLEGREVLLECVLSGLPPPAVSWFREDICLDQSNAYAIAQRGGQCSLRILSPDPEQHSGTYTCRARNDAGSCSSSARVLVNKAVKPLCIEGLQDVTIDDDSDTFTLRCRYQASPAAEALWFLNGRQIALPSSIYTAHNDGSGSASLVAVRKPALGAEAAGAYGVLLRNACGETRSSCSVKLRVKQHTQAPQVLAPLRDVDVLEASPARLECRVSAVPAPQIFWFHDGRQLSDSASEYATSQLGDLCTLVLRRATPQDAGTYALVARNPVGEARTECRLAVDSRSESVSEFELLVRLPVAPPPPPAAAPACRVLSHLSNVTCAEGDPVTLECRIALPPGPPPRVSWCAHCTAMHFT